MTRSAYVMSNTVNLARVISSGLVGPQALFGEKYMEDEASSHGGLLVLHPAQDLPAWGEAEAPVLIEVDAPALDLLDSGPVAVDGVLPSTSIVRILMPDEHLMDEFLSTPYDNVDPSRFVVQVHGVDVLETTARVGGTGHGRPEQSETPSLLDDIKAADEPHHRGATVEHVDRSRSALDAATVERVDRLVGGMAEALRTPQPDRESLARGQSLLEAASGTPELNLEQLVTILTSDTTDLPVVLSERMIDRRIDDARLRSALDGVEQADFFGGIEPERAVAVLRGRADLAGPGSVEHPVLWAFLLALLVDTPESLRKELDGRASQLTMPLAQLAMWFAGLRRGHARTPVTSRSSELDGRLDEMKANALNEHLGELPLRHLADVGVDVADSVDYWSYRLLLPGPVEVGVRPKPSLADRLAKVDPRLLTLATLDLGDPVRIRLRAAEGTEVVVSNRADGLVIDVPGVTEVEVDEVDHAELARSLVEDPQTLEGLLRILPANEAP